MTRAPTVCTEHGCPNIVERSGRCQPCRGKKNAARRKIDYGPKWPVQRASYLRRHPDCERCGAEAREVHHRDERGGEPASNRDENLEALCKSCHGGQTLQPYREREGVRSRSVGVPTTPRGPAAREPIVGGGLVDQMRRRKARGAPRPAAVDDDGWPDVSRRPG